ncbi:uncharacterized protein LOC143203987 [Rhynchophorus ferrugineus]|uniref:uncharacterized protein LOC143203987 n=1 Tax=Rhynchophorus ferrugineus TaxID=354439 RepID=UPI003FCCE74B
MEIGVFLMLIIAVVHAQRSLEENEPSLPRHMNRMGRDLADVPLGDYHVVSLNVAYNKISQVKAYDFYLKMYRNLTTIELGHNRLSSVDTDGFRELLQLTSVDLSNNNITVLHINLFRHNPKLQRLDASSNMITTDPEKPLLRSPSLEVLILGKNRISNLFDITFARTPNLRQLLLDDNDIDYMSRNCFSYLNNLQYISLARTGIHTVSESMFRKLPRLVDLTGTPLSQKFIPSLTKVRTTQLARLIHVERYSSEEDYET